MASTLDKLCHAAYPFSGMTYLASCLTYSKFSSFPEEERCNKCSDVIEQSGYNRACQYFSGPFADTEHPCYGEAMSKCTSWEIKKECM